MLLEIRRKQPYFEKPDLSNPREVTLPQLEAAVEGKDSLITRAVSGGASLYLACERLNKHHELGDLWATDRSRTTFQGRKFQCFSLTRTDLDILKDAIYKRGCV